MSTAGPFPRAKHRNAQHGGFPMSTVGPHPKANSAKRGTELAS